MILFFLRFFGFGHLNCSVASGLGPKIDKMGCPDFGPQIGHFRGGFGSAGPIFANFRHFSATNIGGYLLITRKWFLIFLSLFDNLPFRRRKTRARARAHRGRIVTRNGRKKGQKWAQNASQSVPFYAPGNGPKRRTPFVIGNSARLALGRPKRPRRLKAIKAEISLNF